MSVFINPFMRWLDLEEKLKNLDGWQYRRCLNKSIEKEMKDIQNKYNDSGINPYGRLLKKNTAYSMEWTDGYHNDAALGKYDPLNYIIVNDDLSIGIVFNPYLPSFLLEEEIIKLKKKLQSGLVKSIWLQFGTDCRILESRIEILKKIIFSSVKNNSKKSNIKLFGSLLVPSKQLLVRFNYRPWKGVYCSQEFLESVDFARNMIMQLLITYKKYDICPIIETDTSTEVKLDLLKNNIDFLK